VRKGLPVLSVLLAGSLWGCIGLFVRGLTGAGLSSMELVALRSIVTAAVLLIWLLLRDRAKLKICLRDLWCFLGTGLCSIVFFNFCYFSAIQRTSLSVASVLLYTAPCIVMLLSLLLFHEACTPAKLVALAMSLLGLCLVTGLLGGGRQRVTAAGILYGCGAGLGYALYSVFGRFALNRGYHPLTITLYTFFTASVGSLLLCGGQLHLAFLATFPAAAADVLLLGTVCGALPYVSYTWGLTHMEASRASILASVEPVVATLLGVMCFHEKLTLPGGCGVLLVLGALLVLNLQSPSEAQQSSTA
jgi:DME family drug/metabolite transporter